MKKYTEFEEARDAYKERLHHTIEQQIAKIEGTIEVLLDGVDMSELTSKDRLSIAARFISLHQRAIAQQHLLDTTSDDNDATLTLLSIARRMRGEVDTEKEEFHVMETELTV